ncbi:isoprenoid synthase domain-containing protein [Flammula alnicola]|nr:isoprenoid synthase domain-containing protein [Flammula alnicola]
MELPMTLPSIDRFPPIHQAYADYYAANHFPYKTEEDMNWYIDMDLAAYVYMTVPWGKNHARMEAAVRLHLLYFLIDDLLDKNLITINKETLQVMLPPQDGKAPVIPESFDKSYLPVLKASSEMWTDVKEELPPSDYEKVSRPIDLWFKDLRLSKGYTNVDELLELRVNDVAMAIVYACVYYSMELSIPDHEYDSPEVKRCTNVATKICAIVNDMASYMKEVRDNSVENNLITKIQDWKKCTAFEAKQDLLNRVPKLYEELYKVCNAVLKSDMCMDTKQFVAALPYVVSGNTWWHNYSIRYDEGRGQFYCQDVKPCDEIACAA